MHYRFFNFLLCMLSIVMLSSMQTKSEKPKSSTKSLITLTYNIHHGAPDKSDVVNLQDIADVIKKSGAALVALQEIDVNVPRSGNTHQAEELAKLLDMHFYFSKSIDYSGGEYGVAILSKYPLSNTRNGLLPMPTSGEQRSIALATVNLPGDKSIEFASTHLDLNAENRMAQVIHLNELSQKLNKPLFIGGDYNAQPHSAEMLTLKKEFALSCMDECPLTIPVKNPARAIDFVAHNKFATSKFKFQYATAMEGEYASDHLPLIAIYTYEF